MKLFSRMLGMKMLLTTVCSRGAAEKPFDNINAVVGMAHSSRGRALTLIQPIASNIYSIVFMHSEHPKLTENDTLEKIASEYIADKVPQDDYDSMKGECKNLSQKLEDTLKSILLKDLPDSPMPKFLCSFLRIILTDKWIYYFQFYMRPDEQPFVHAINGLSQVATVKSGVDHHRCTGMLNFLGGFKASYEQVVGTDACAKAATLQNKNPACPFHFIIDDTAWRKICAEHTMLE